MVPRTLATKLRESVRRYPVVSVTGPRQSGKTTLVRDTLSALRVRVARAARRAPACRCAIPRAFLGQFKKPVIIDEAQRAPDLFSYIQVAVDERAVAGRFVLTGSQNFLLLQAVSQSLAGRCAVLHLLPFSQAELGAPGARRHCDASAADPAFPEEAAGRVGRHAVHRFLPAHSRPRAAAAGVAGKLLPDVPRARRA